MGRDSLGRTTNMSSKSFTNVHLTAYPSFSYFPSELRPSMSASRTRELTGDVEDAAVWDAAGVKERDQRTTPPAPPGWPSVPDCERSWGRKMRTLVRDGAVVEHGEDRERVSRRGLLTVAVGDRESPRVGSPESAHLAPEIDHVVQDRVRKRVRVGLRASAALAQCPTRRDVPFRCISTHAAALLCFQASFSCIYWVTCSIRDSRASSLTCPSSSSLNDCSASTLPFRLPLIDYSEYRPTSSSCSMIITDCHDQTMSRTPLNVTTNSYEITALPTRPYYHFDGELHIPFS